MKEKMYELYKTYGKLSKKVIDDEPSFQSYNTMLRKYGLNISVLNREFNERLYNENPIKCLHCNNGIAFCKEVKIKKFCDHSCSASYNNKITKLKEKGNCLYCDSKLDKKNKKYCSANHQQKYQYKITIEEWKNGNIVGYVGETKQLSKWLRRYIYESRGTACSICGWNDKHPCDGKTLTEIDHIDGDAENCTEENLRVLCPNCHSKTHTYRSRNKNSKRNRK